MTADAINRTVVAGPVEATAVGNVLLQALALGHIADHAELRRIVKTSFPVETFTPRTAARWAEAHAHASKSSASAVASSLTRGGARAAFCSVAVMRSKTSLPPEAPAPAPMAGFSCRPGPAPPRPACHLDHEEVPRSGPGAPDFLAGAPKPEPAPHATPAGS